MGAPPQTLVRVLDADPALRGGLAGQALELARTVVLAPVLALDGGSWRPEAPERDDRHLGFLVLAGAFYRGVTLGGRASAELLGPGDLLRPWQRLRFAEPSSSATWSVVQPATLAILDGRFTGLVGRWPDIVAALVARAVERSRALVVTLGIAQMTGVELRVLAMLWHLAERFGHQDDEHWVLPVPLTHQMLAGLARTQRPTVTTALSRLADGGLVARSEDGAWLLRGEPPDGFAALRRALDH